ncbi:MAG TPA: ABC transporter permease [Azospirillaceae bacterium]|nr:ABC transporter permease [Azospirillaceae bacterium]
MSGAAMDGTAAAGAAAPRPMGGRFAPGTAPTLALTALVAAGSAVALSWVHAPGTAGQAGAGFWTYVLVLWALATWTVQRLTRLRATGRWSGRALGLAAPLAFGAFALVLWELVIAGFGVPVALMPAPSAIWARIVTSLPVLAADFVQTFVKAVLTGYAMGAVAGFVVAIAADRVPFLKRGLLPLGNFVAALPIVGIAPIMVMWFGFDWQSKAAVVVVMTFFPMLVNTVSGLSAAGSLERDLMRSYAAGYWQTLVKLRLPAALPFIFNALKINSTLALIGAIVAEFFGTPVVGMGFRISVEAARLALDMVWAEIAVAALAGSAFYGLVALAERAATFWHPSYRA